MAEIGISNSTDDSNNVIKKWDSVNLFSAAFALAADSWMSYAGDLSGSKVGALRLLAFGALMLLVFDYRIAKRLVDVFKLRQASSSTITWLKLNVAAVLVVGVLNCINLFFNVFNIELNPLLVITEGICTIMFFSTQIFVIVKLFKVGQSKLGISIIAFMLAQIILSLALDGGDPSVAMLCIAIALNVILGVRMYYQFNAFFGEDTEGWHAIDNIF